MNDPALFPIGLSLKVAALALLLVLVPGVALAWLQARRRYPGWSLVEGLILLPMVLPPSVIGYFLVVVLGRNGAVGRLLEDSLGIRLIFTQAGAVVAASVVALPMLVKTLQPSLSQIPPGLEAAGRTLGLGPLALFFRVTVPLAWRGLVAGGVLAFARALGEFGATLMFAGNIPGRTNTMPLEIFAAYQAGEDSRALLYVVALTAASVVVAVLSSVLSSRGATQ